MICLFAAVAFQMNIVKTNDLALTTGIKPHFCSYYVCDTASDNRVKLHDTTHSASQMQWHQQVQQVQQDLRRSPVNVQTFPWRVDVHLSCWFSTTVYSRLPANIQHKPPWQHPVRAITILTPTHPHKPKGSMSLVAAITYCHCICNNL